MKRKPPPKARKPVKKPPVKNPPRTTTMDLVSPQVTPVFVPRPKIVQKAGS